MKIFTAIFMSLLVVGMYFVDFASATQHLEDQKTNEENSQTKRRKYSIQQFLDTKSYMGASFTCDEERLLYSCDASGIFNIYSMKIDGTEVSQLSFSENQSRPLLSSFPRDHRFLFTSDGLGNELSHIWMQNLDGTVRDLTPVKNARFEFYGWSYNGLSFFYGSNQRNPCYMDLYEMNAVTFKSQLLIENECGWAYEAFSRDKRFVALTKRRNANDNELYLYNLAARDFEVIAQHAQNANYSAACFSPDSKDLYFVTDEDEDFLYLKKYCLETGATETIAKYDWDVVDFNISYFGRYQITTLNQEAKASIRIFDTKTQSFIELPCFPHGGDIQHVKISKSEKWMLFYVNGCRSPSNLYIFDFDSQTCRQLTSSLSQKIEADDLVEAKVIRYASYDGMEIPALFYQPVGSGPGNPAPALIWMHGGPGGQSTVHYNYLIQYLVNHGYAVLAVNNRGSSGYGKAFFQAADLKHGEADLDDCIFAKKFLISTGSIDKERIGILGGSYGGYLTLAALAFRPNEMAVGIDMFGVSNWVRTLRSIPTWWEAERETLYQKIGNPETDDLYLRSISPLFHAENIKKPLLVIQGANDPRVLEAESEEIVEAVTKNGVPCEYLLFSDEGHGFMKKANRETSAESILKFLNKYL